MRASKPTARITLLGRGSMCINSAGEKVYPEEVEEVVKRHEAIYDCLVVGVPDDRFGERVVAVASLREGAQADPTMLIEYTREHLASYKAPRHVLLVDQVRRAPNGKADYKWAKATALAELRPRVMSGSRDPNSLEARSKGFAFSI